jgi:hypothetical protein
MKNKIAIVIAILIAVFAVSSSYAQVDGFKPKKTPEERAQKMAEKMSQKLSLSSEQYNKVYDIILNHAQQADQIRNSTENNPGQGLDKLCRVNRYTVAGGVH